MNAQLVITAMELNNVLDALVAQVAYRVIKNQVCVTDVLLVMDLTTPLLIAHSVLQLISVMDSLVVSNAL